MYEQPKYSQGQLNINNGVPGETLEQKIERIVSGEGETKQGDGAPLLYTERKEGIRASTNIRTDRFEVAIDATDKIARSYKARREERAEMKIVKKDENESEGQSIQAK